MKEKKTAFLLIVLLLFSCSTTLKHDKKDSATSVSAGSVIVQESTEGSAGIDASIREDAKPEPLGNSIDETPIPAARTEEAPEENTASTVSVSEIDNDGSDTDSEIEETCGLDVIKDEDLEDGFFDKEHGDSDTVDIASEISNENISDNSIVAEEPKLLRPVKTITHTFHPTIPPLPRFNSVVLNEDLSQKTRSEVLYLSINNSNDEDLRKIAKEFGIEQYSGDIKSSILKKLGVDSAVKNDNDKENIEEEVSSKHGFNINNADVIEKVSINGYDFIHIDGNVRIEFDASGTKRSLSSDSILFDAKSNEILAFGNINISTGSSDSQLQNLEADGLLLNFNSDKLRLIDATGKTQRANSTYYMSGDEITLDNITGEIYFKNGALLPSRDVDNAIWRIASKDIIMKNNGDLFLSGVLLKVGRVPILPLPAIFMPGTPLSFNPAIGFVSDKGAFVNTTYELYGEYPGLGKSGEGNSLTNLFKSATGGSVKKDGLLYVLDSKKASSRGSDYMALFADVYSSEGIFLGLDTKNKFTSLNMSLDAIAGVAYKPQRKSTYISSSTYNNFRYLLDLKYNLSYLGINGELTLPFYSDPYVKNHYLNRFTGFSFDSIFASNQKFPETYSSYSNNEFEWSGNFTYSIPSKLRSKYLESLSLKTSISHARYWAKGANGNNDKYSYASSSTTLPSFTLSLSGTLFSYSSADSSSKESSKKRAKNTSKSQDYRTTIENQLLLLREAEKIDTESPVENESSESVDNELNELVDNELDEFADVEIEEGIPKTIEQEEIGVENIEEITVEDSVEISDEVLDKNYGEDLQNIQDEEFTEESDFIFEKKRFKARATIDTQKSTRTVLSGSYISLNYSINEDFSNAYRAPEDLKKILGEKRINSSLSSTFTLKGGLGNIFTFSEDIRPSYTYRFQEDANNLENHESVITSSSYVSVPLLGLGYSLGSQLFSYKSSKDDKNDRTEMKDSIKFDKEHINSHSLSISKSFKFVNFSLSGTLPPILLSLNPRISFKFDKISIYATHILKGDNLKSVDSYQTEGGLTYSNKYMNLSTTVYYDYESAKQSNHFLYPFRVNESFSANFLKSWIRFNQSSSFSGNTSQGDENYFQYIKASLALKNNYLVFNVSFKGVADALKLDTTTVSLTVPTFSFAFWKNRIVSTIGFKSNMNLDFKDAYQNSLNYSISLRFEIKEFLDISFSLDGQNNNFTKYTGSQRYGKFNITDFFVDILRGINVFNTQDMVTSNFKMSRLNVSLVHDMGDWDLNFAFNGNFEADGNEYKFVPKYTLTLKWKVIPELKVDKTITL